MQAFIEGSEDARDDQPQASTIRTMLVEPTAAAILIGIAVNMGPFFH